MCIRDSTSTYRIYFKKSGKKRIARMVDSPHHPEQEVIFGLGEEGVIDPEGDTKKKKTTKVVPKPNKTVVPDTTSEKVESDVLDKESVDSE